MEKTAAGPVKSRSSKGEAVRNAMTRSGLGISTLSMAENVPRHTNPATSCKQSSFGRLGSGDRARSIRFVGLRRYQARGWGPILDTGERAEGNGISQCVEWRNTVFPIRPSFPGEDVDGARLQGA